MGIREWAVISRFKMEIATIVNPLVGIVFVSDSLESLCNIFILLYLIAYLLIIVASSQLNCYFDMNVDRHYKINLYKAAKYIGERKIKTVSSVMFVASLILAAYIGFSGYWKTALMICIGAVIAIFYSTPPLRLKSKGVVGIIFLALGIFVLPLLGGGLLMRNNIQLPFLEFIFGYAMLNTSFILINIGEDYEEDLKEGIKTIFHVIGEKKVMKIAKTVLAVGVAIIVYSIIHDNIDYASLFFLVIFLLASFYAYIDLNRIGKGNIKENLKKYGKKVPIWFAITRYPLLLSIFVHLLK